MFKKINKHYIIELISILIITLIFNLVCNEIASDEIWCYGFSYNIASGLIPYKDFNMIITPLFPFLASIFMSIFGKNIIIFHIFNAIICTCIFHCMKQIASKSYFITYAILLLFSVPNYNLLCLLFLYIIILLEKNESNDYIIGLILSLIFLTKQNIGVCILIPSLIIKNKSKIIKRIIGFIIPNLFLLIYLVYNKCFYNFIDYCFLGIMKFSEQNVYIHVIPIIIIILCIIYIFYKYYKTKDKNLIYLLFFLAMSYPIFDQYHVAISTIPLLNYFFNQQKLNKKIISIAFILFIICTFIYNQLEYHNEKYIFFNETNTYKYRKIYKYNDIIINNISEYIKNNDETTYIINNISYAAKLNIPITTNKYDLLLNGNMGKNGDEKIIKEFNKICKKEKCAFIIDKNQQYYKNYNQYNKKIYDYIVNTYKEKEKIMNFSIYKNY